LAFAQTVEEKISIQDTNVAVPNGDDQAGENNTIHAMAGIEKKPDFPGGLAKFHEFVNRNFNLNAGYKGKGKVFVMFVVEKDGSLSDIKVLRDVGFDTGKEAVRLLKAAPRWIPGEQNGKKVRVHYSLPIEINSEKMAIKSAGNSPDKHPVPHKNVVHEPVEEKIEDGNTIHNIARLQVKPDFPGGLQEFFKFVDANYKIPDEAGLKGNVFVTFVVEKDGSLSNIKILREIGFGTGDEAIRVLKLSPKWQPGQKDGKVVRTQYSLPIRIIGKEKQ